MYSQKFFIFHQTYTTYFINIMYYYFFFFFQLSVWVDGLSSLLGKEVRTRNLFHPFSKVTIVLISWGSFFSTPNIQTLHLFGSSIFSARVFLVSTEVLQFVCSSS